MCAIYAFMRRADDLADDESFSVAERRVHLNEWLGKWRAACEGAATQDRFFWRCATLPSGLPFR